mmetsp:Transcript_15126/g.30721  ORF Transcript_15126/g.30721 Transcript_15126/m.30721 type:complete len:148 (-) Transcript_15126:237-680(-)
MEIPSEIGWTILSTGISALVSLGVQMWAGSFRAKYQVPTPYLYADSAMVEKNKDAEKFNFAQRGAQNPLESYPAMLALTWAGAIKYPRLSALSLFFHSVGWVQYFRGYAESPKKRYANGGGLIRLAFLGQFILVIAEGVIILTSKRS